MKKLCIISWFFFSFIVFGQQEKPKIGLVLSGGGAKGFAHIGILKQIDKAGIKLDYIGGTSMGAIIGGLYASGYTALQIEEIIKKNDFNAILRDQLPRNSTPFFVKEHGENTFVTFPVQDGKIGLPRAVSKGQNVLNLLYELLDHVKHINNFRELPTPFYCIATDVETGGEVIMETGSLPLALRTSGSFPTLLNPVLLNNQLLVDGGIANNFPISFMKQKGIDIVIGVDVEGRLFEKEKLTSVIDILNQIVSYQMYHKSDEEKKKIDVYIHPDIYNYNVVDFGLKDSILHKGDVTGEKFARVFEELAKKQGNLTKREDLILDSKKKVIDQINIKGTNFYDSKYILGKLKIKNGDSITNHELTERIQFVSATNNYDRIWYNLKPNKNNFILELDVKESNKLASISFGLHYDLLYKSGILANYTHKHLLFDNDLLSLDVVAGDNIRYNLNYFVDNGFNISFGVQSRYNHFRANSKFKPVLSQFPNLNSINLKYTDFTNQAFLQTTFSKKFALGIGVEQKYINASTETISTNSQEFKIEDSNFYNAYGFLKLDTYDSKDFPTKGFFADINFTWYLSSPNNPNFARFAQGRGSFGFARSFWDNFTLQVTNEVGFTIENPKTDIFDFYLGGYNKNYINNFVAFYGYDFAELSENSYLKSQLDLRYQFAKKHYATAIVNFARMDANVFKDINLFSNVLKGYAIGYSYKSFLGPIELKYSWSPANTTGFWLFNLGFWF